MNATSSDEMLRDEMTRLCDSVEKADFPETLGDFVRGAALRHGQATVGVWFNGETTLSYAQLDEWADRLASSLVRIGVRKGTHVGVMLPNTPAYPVTWVALARIGAVMVPVNTAYRINDLFFVLQDSDAQFLIVDAEFVPIYEQIDRKPSYLASERIIVHGDYDGSYRQWADMVRDGSESFIPPSQVKGTDLLNIQYTSGTTGFPKGCLLCHDYWLLILKFASAPLVKQGGVQNVLIWQPFFYMDGMWLFLTAMQLGGCAYVAKKMRLSLFHDWLEQFKIHYCIFPEVALKARAPSPADKKLPLRYVSIYGWSQASRKAFRGRYSAIAREGYGMSEIGLGLLMPNGADSRALEKTCGLPGPFRKMRVVDENGQDVPDGVTGELWVSGRAILWGYYKRPEVNAAAFDGGWFHTGDLFYRDVAGFYYLVGRSKDMIKRSGENVAAREVEATLCELTQVAEAAVVGVKDLERGEEVKAYILLREGVTPGQCPPSDIISHCERRLAPFKVPRYITYVDEFPRTPSRKIRKPEMIAIDEKLQLAVYDRKQVASTPSQGQPMQPKGQTA